MALYFLQKKPSKAFYKLLGKKVEKLSLDNAQEQAADLLNALS